MPTQFEQHVAAWKDCRRCHLWHGRTKVVLARGVLPATVVLVGEAPGKTEDVLGRPFTGIAGHLLDEIIVKSIPEGMSFALTNLVACIPLGEEGEKTGAPDDESIKACAPRLIELIAMANPKLIVCVGALARDWLKQGFKHSIQLPKGIAQVDIQHPAAVLRLNLAQRGLAVQRAVARISMALEELEGSI